MIVGGSNNVTVYYDSGSANQGHLDTGNSYTTPTDPTGASHNNNKYSIYATYTASGGDAADVGQFFLSDE